MGEFVAACVALIIGIFSSLIYDYLCTKISWVRNYPDVQKNWTCEYTDSQNQQIIEQINVENQFLNRISGTFTSSKKVRSTSGNYSYSFTGKFLDKKYVSISFESIDNSFTDYGTAIYKLETDHENFEGGSVSLSIETGEIFVHRSKGKVEYNV